MEKTFEDDFRKNVSEFVEKYKEDYLEWLEEIHEDGITLDQDVIDNFDYKWSYVENWEDLFCEEYSYTTEEFDSFYA